MTDAAFLVRAERVRAALVADLVLRLSRAAIVLQLSTVTRCHVSGTYARSVHNDDIMHYVRTLNIYELFNDTLQPASINYAFFHPSRAYTHACRVLSVAC